MEEKDKEQNNESTTILTKEKPQTIQECLKRIAELDRESSHLNNEIHEVSQKLELMRSSIKVQKTKKESKNYKNLYGGFILLICFSIYILLKK